MTDIKQGHPYFGISDTGNFREPTIVQIVYYKKTGKLEKSHDGSSGRVDITAPIGNEDGRKLTLKLLNRVKTGVKKVKSIEYQNYALENKLKMKAVGNLEFKEDDHELVQILYLPINDDIEVLSTCNKSIVLQMIARAKNLLLTKSILVVPAVFDNCGMLSRMLH